MTADEPSVDITADQWAQSELQNPDLLEQLPTDLAYLVQLGRLRAAGILTEPEYVYRKRRVLTGPLPDNWITVPTPRHPEPGAGGSPGGGSGGGGTGGGGTGGGGNDDDDDGNGGSPGGGPKRGEDPK